MKLGYFKHLIYLFKRLYWEYRWKITSLILLGFTGSLLDALSIGVLVPLFSFMLKESSFSNDIVSRIIFGVFGYFSIEPGLEILLILICFLFIFKAGVLWIFEYMRSCLSNSFMVQNRQKLYSDLLKSKWTYLIKQKIGHLDNILMVDLKNSMGLFKMAVSIISSLATFFAYLLVAVSLSYYVTLAALIFGLIILFSVKSTFIKARLYALRAVELRKVTAHFINESIIGLKIIKAIGAENRIAAKGAEIFEKAKKLALKIFFANTPAAAIEPSSVIFIAGVFAVSYRLDPGLNIAAFLVTMYLIQRIFNFIQRIQANFRTFNSCIPPGERVVRLKNELTENLEIDSGQLDFLFNDKLEFRNVSFFYRPHKLIFKNIDWNIKKGEVVAILGKTGEGKTTIADLLLRFLNPTEGEIVLDGKNIKEIKLSEWRNNIGYVSQEIFLSNNTIANNIKFLNERITDEEMIEATKKANIYDFIQSLPKKFNTIVGERGIFLSGGQRQRIALARAFVEKPKILILDEATSSLDGQSEAAIKDAISKLKKEMTVIIISHKLSFIMDAENVFILDNGKIIEKGRLQELLKNKNSHFHKLYYINSK